MHLWGLKAIMTSLRGSKMNQTKKRENLAERELSCIFDWIKQSAVLWDLYHFNILFLRVVFMVSIHEFFKHLMQNLIWCLSQNWNHKSLFSWLSSEAHLLHSCSKGKGTATRCPSQLQNPRRTWWSPSVWSRFLSPPLELPQPHFQFQMQPRPGSAAGQPLHLHHTLGPLQARVPGGELTRPPPLTRSRPLIGGDWFHLDRKVKRDEKDSNIF